MQQEMTYYMLATFSDSFSDADRKPATAPAAPTSTVDCHGTNLATRDARGDGGGARQHRHRRIQDPSRPGRHSSTRPPPSRHDRVVDDFDPHALDEQDFLDEVHSFQFWFDSVEGYLAGSTVRPARDDRRRGARRRPARAADHHTVQLLRRRDRSARGRRGLVQLAPDRNSKIFMATQVVDEARHLEVFLHRLRELGVADPEREIERRAQPALVDFKGALLELVEQGDWQAALFAQNVILETMEYTVFRLHAANADPVTRTYWQG